LSTDQRTIDAYNEYANSYHNHVLDPADSPLHEYYEKPALRAELKNLKGASVLSVGCGSGADAAWAKSNGAKDVTGIDISTKLIAIARKTYPGISFSVMDMEHLDFDDESFDIVYSSLALHYVRDWAPVLLKIRNILKPKGKFIFSCNHPIETALEPFRSRDTHGMRLGLSISNISSKRKTYGNYMSVKSGGVKPRSSTIGDDKLVYSYHRTFSNMLNSILSSGLKIVKVVEPIPVPKMKNENPEHYKQVLAIPKFMLWVLEK